MADAMTTDRPNKIQISEAGPSRKKIAIEIPAQTVTEKLSESLDVLSTEASIPGFRKGRVPRELLERKFGSSIRKEAKGQLIASAYQQAIEENGLKVVGEPEGGEGLEDAQLESGKAFCFEVEVEVLPEFELPTIEGIKVLRPTFEVTDEMVDAEVEKIRVNDGELEEREAAEPGDYVTGHAVMTPSGGGEEFYNLDGAVVQIPQADAEGKGMILGILVEDLASQLGTPKAEDKLTIKAKGPEQHEIEGVRGTDLEISYTVHRVDRIIPAEVSKVLSSYGFESEDELKGAVRRRLEQRAQINQHTAVRQQIARHLIKSVEMTLPDRLTAGQAARWLQQRRMELMYRGLDQAAVEQHMAELRNVSNTAARNELKLFFVLAKAAEELGVSVNEGELNGRIAQIARERGARPEKMRQELIQSNQINTIYRQIMEHKALDAIAGKAEVEEVSAEDFNKKMEEQSKADAAEEAKG